MVLLGKSFVLMPQPNAGHCSYIINLEKNNTATNRVVLEIALEESGFKSLV